MGTIKPSDQISTALFGKARLAVLGLFFTHTDESFYLRQIVRTVDLGQGAIQRELARLTEAGILIRKRQGNQVFYQANSDSPVFSEIKSLMVKTGGIAEVLKSAFRKLTPQIRIAFVFGSFASGEASKKSDVDLMVIGNISLRDLAGALHGPQEILGREVNPSIFTADEFRKKLFAKHHFLTSILSVPKIFLIGDQYEFEKLASKRLVG